jgi:hypothetical protein
MPKNRINFTDDFVLREGKIGIGTTNPTTKLQVTGELKVTSVGATTGEEIILKHYRANGGSLAFESGENHLFSVTNQVDDLIYSISDADGTPSFRVFNSGITSITNGFIGVLTVGTSISAGTLVQTPIVDFLSPGAGTSTKITAKHYTTNNGSLAFESGENHLFSVTNETGNLLYSINDDNANSILSVSTIGNVGVGTSNPTFNLHVIGSFGATTKSFIIEHPTKENKKLQYGSLEGPELGVYVRGRSSKNVIELPDYWINLVNLDSLTINLTPIGISPVPRVLSIEGMKINVFSLVDGDLDYYYYILAERKDVDKLQVELDK